jgi:hypothetical protein
MSHFGLAFAGPDLDGADLGGSEFRVANLDGILKTVTRSLLISGC